MEAFLQISLLLGILDKLKPDLGMLQNHGTIRD